MPFQLKISVCPTGDCSSLTFNELTGIGTLANDYSGWANHPFISIFFQRQAVLIAISPSGVTTTIDLFTLGFPTDDITTQLILSLPYEDGLWSFTYNVTDLYGEVYTATSTEYFYCNSSNCITKMLANLKLSSCESCNHSVEESTYLRGFMLLESLKNAALCGSLDTFNSIKKILDKLCKNILCKTCK